MNRNLMQQMIRFRKKKMASLKNKRNKQNKKMACFIGFILDFLWGWRQGERWLSV